MSCRLTLVSATGDRELDAIRDTIDACEPIVDLDHTLSTLRSHSRRGRRTEILDFVGHSRTHGFVMLGSWLIDDSPQTSASFSELLRPSLQLLGVRVIRLLGCATATTERSRTAIRQIARAARCSVLGTKRYIGRRDYGPAGFMSDAALIDADGRAG